MKESEAILQAFLKFQKFILKSVQSQRIYNPGVYLWINMGIPFALIIFLLQRLLSLEENFVLVTLPFIHELCISD